ncbi:hypothetical protein Patl1_29030 [Pistacia atlantica]|uniref:Uncharacterized protein n=1 Tax=Pistacia atlantica TaxID=434234 RepID=A0ACC1BD33_9ROSI|nr:hypothetical protein Patl1_29030 [Pistacia atlantica]
MPSNMFSVSEMPQTVSSLFSAYASLAGTMMLLRSMANDFIPHQLRSLVSSLFYYLFPRLSNTLCLVIDQQMGMSPNQVYDAAEIYLRTKISPKTERLIVGKSTRQNHFTVSIDKGEEVSDCFENFQLKWQFICTQPENNSYSSEKRHFELTFNKKHKETVMNRYLPYVLEKADKIKREERVVKLYNRDCPYDDEDGGGCGMWGSINLEHPSTFDTLALEPELKKMIIDDLDRFLRRKEFYNKVGKAWKRGYLLYGPPGTGKSSLIAAMANYLRFDVYDIELTSIYSNSDLRRILLSTTNRSIWVIEDIDCSAEAQDRQNGDGYEDSKLTLSGILNFIDGLWSCCGDERIIVFTTNHKDRLDPALLRPGRMDVHIHLSYCTVNGFKLLVSNYLGIQDSSHPLFGEIEDLIQSTEVTPAQVAEELMRSDDADAALQGLVNFLKRKNEIKNIEVRGEKTNEIELETKQSIADVDHQKSIFWGSKMVDAVVTVFLEKLLNTLSEQSRFVNEFRDQFKRLEKELQLMQCFLKDADRHKRKSKNETLRQIMANLRELIYEAEDILADCQLQSQDDDQVSNSWLNCIYPPNLQFQYGTGKRLREINEKITRIKDDISSLLNIPLFNRMETNDICNGRSDRWSGPVYDHTQVVGLEGDTRKIKDWLIEAEEGILAIGVVGMGGLGKTTIAQMVFNDREMENRFERRMWVSVSQTFTQEQIMRSMLRTLGDASVGDDGGELLRKISLYLSGKRYLLVMDDVWSENTDWWQRIREGLPKGKGSSIIITTRNEKVAQRMGVKEEKVHRPRFLSSDDSWLLFRKIAFAATGGECMYPLLQDVGREIVEKCQGLPLAIKAVGGMMLYKAPTYPEWRRTANNFLDELSENDGSVMASLQLSYDELPSYLKSCFPQFLSLSRGLCHYKRAISPLVDWGGICPCEKCTCKIHDMVRDLVIKAAEEDAFFRSNGMSCRHLGIKSEMQKKQLIGNSKLRALLSTTKSAEVNNIASSIATKFSECCYLRVLDLSRSIFEMPLKGLLNQIGSLQHLTCLSLSNTHPLIQLPPSLEKLNNLQILDVSYCQNLKMLPPYIVSFKKLRVLDVSHCGSLEYVPKGLGKLSNLEVLLGFRPARSNQLEGCRISELRNLTRLRTLGLQFTCGDEIGGDEVNALINLNELQFLSISCFDSHGSDLIAKVDKLYPPQQLDELSLSFYPGKTSPIWLNPASLPMLRYLLVSSGNIESMHESFWGENNTIWKIEALMFESLSDLGLYWVELQEVMPSLRIVNATWCPELHSFPIEDVGFRGGVWMKEEQNMHM